MVLKSRYACVQAMFFRILFCLVIFAPLASAKVGDSKPVRIGHRVYRSHANNVEAVDIRTNQVIWKTQVYPSIDPERADPTLEQDVQWNIIVSIEKSGKYLLVRNRKGQTFFIDVNNGEVFKGAKPNGK